MFEGLRSGSPGGAEPLAGEGTALDGRVHAVVVSPGQVEKLEMDPRVMRDGSEAVCDALATAVNAALEDLRTKAAAEAGGYNVQQVQEDFERMQTESLDAARNLFGAVHEAMARLDRRR
ncbi:hypothetical protein GCM10027569_67330 [Flindersiella endophytica]